MVHHECGSIVSSGTSIPIETARPYIPEDGKYYENLIFKFSGLILLCNFGCGVLNHSNVFAYVAVVIFRPNEAEESCGPFRGLASLHPA
jgi:hypothetical protein